MTSKSIFDAVYLLGMGKLIDTFLTSATLEVRIMPGIGVALASYLAQAMLTEVTKRGSYGAQAHVICREDHVSISIEDVELSEMTVIAYAEILDRLRQIARDRIDAPE